LCNSLKGLVWPQTPMSAFMNEANLEGNGFHFESS
jgi:hypothetical protein